MLLALTFRSVELSPPSTGRECSTRSRMTRQLSTSCECLNAEGHEAFLESDLRLLFEQTAASTPLPELELLSDEPKGALLKQVRWCHPSCSFFGRSCAHSFMPSFILSVPCIFLQHFHRGFRGRDRLWYDGLETRLSLGSSPALFCFSILMCPLGKVEACCWAYLKLFAVHFTIHPFLVLVAGHCKAVWPSSRSNHCRPVVRDYCLCSFELQEVKQEAPLGLWCMNPTRACRFVNLRCNTLCLAICSCFFAIFNKVLVCYLWYSATLT